ncbi:hypothetical protein ACFQ40_01420 [Kroppenstedtia eburnea]|uniref:hypothetical protein n=1 Tax=Kroppenstedtia eburnea TaxID=714067 RepID=UPI003625077A
MGTITRETRRESFDSVLKTLETRQTVVLKELQKCPRLTANELAVRLWNKGVIPMPERNRVHPRLTELVEAGEVAVTGKRTCSISGKKCAVYEPVDTRSIQGSLF